MAKLAKNKYTTAKGERKINCYLATIPKSIINQVNIDDDDEIVVYAEYGQIIINKKYHCTCQECGYEWDDGHAYDICTSCPRCGLGDIRYEINGGSNDN